MLVRFVLIPLRIRVFSWCCFFRGNSKWDSERPRNFRAVPSSFFSFVSFTDPGATHTQDAPPSFRCCWLLQNDLHLPQHRWGAEHYPVLAERLSDRARHIVRRGGGMDCLNGLSVWEFSLNPQGTPKRGAACIIQCLLRQGHLQLNHVPRGEAPPYLFIFFLKNKLPVPPITR